MKVLITGITGMVGSTMADYLLDKAEIVGLKRWRSPMDNVKHLIGKIRFYDGDLKDLSSMINIISQESPDVIYHFGAQSEVLTSFSMPAETLMDNGIGTLNLLEAIRIVNDSRCVGSGECEGQELYNPIIVIASSSEVYGQVSKEDIPIKETCPLRPVSPYAVSKVNEDNWGYMYHIAYDMEIIRTRMFTHTGARRHYAFHESSFARQIALIEKGLQPPVIKVGNLDSIRTYLDVKDAVRAYWMVKDCPAGEVYNIGGDFTCTVGQTLGYLMVLSTYQGDIKIEVDQSRLRPSDVTNQIPCVDKFKQATNWQREVPFKDTLQSLLDYWREHI